MIERDPGHRLSADDYLVQQKGKAFPTYFYTYLKVYLQYYRNPAMIADDKVLR